jgi:surface protein
MNDMFLGATSFNQPLNNWNVSNVTDMEGVFAEVTVKYNPSTSRSTIGTCPT